MNTLIYLFMLKLCFAYGDETSGYSEVMHNRSSSFTNFSNILYNFYEDGDQMLSYPAFESFYNCSVGIKQCRTNFSITYERTQIGCNSQNASNLSCNLLYKCVPAADVLSLLHNKGHTIEYMSKEEFLSLLPVVAYQSQGQFCDQSDVKKLSSSRLPSSAEVWCYGLLFVTLISSCSLIGVSVLPLMAKDFYQKLLTVLVGLASGSLLASAVFHLIPQAFKLTTNVKDHSYLFISLGLLSGIWGFFMIERFINILLQRRKLQKADRVHAHEIHFKAGEDSGVSTVAWMIIFGDGFHNFIDGVSIGAAFQQSILTGISISLAVFCEELPHELGDFAVLVSSGMTAKRALFYNFLSATTCYLGMGVGILLGEFTQDSTYIFALAAGMFLYIALVDMMPEMRETAEESMKGGVKELIKVLLLQNIGMITGVLILFFLAYYQEYLSWE